MLLYGTSPWQKVQSGEEKLTPQAEIESSG